MRSILILGADPATVSVYRGHFERAGITVASAEIVRPLLDFVRLANPAAVLLDLTRADTDGAHLVREIRSGPEFTALPVFVLAEQGSVKALSLRAVGDSAKVFWKTPIASAALLEAVTAALNARQDPGEKAGEKSPAGNPVVGSEPDELGEAQADHPSPSDLPGAMRALSEAFRIFCAAGESKRSESLGVLQEQMRGFRRLLLADEQTILTAFTAALLRLTITLSKDGASVRASCLRTLSTAIDLLAHAMANQDQLHKFGAAPIRVLVLDDGTDSRRALQYALCSPELGLVVCERCDDALESLRTASFDVVLADTRMIQDGGFPAQLRQLPNGENIPLILLTAMPALDARIHAFMNGGCDVIATPYVVSEVVVKAFTFALKRRLGQTASNRCPVQNPDPRDLNVNPDGGELELTRVGLDESPARATANLEAAAGGSEIPTSAAGGALPASEPPRQAEPASGTREQDGNSHGAGNGHVSEPESALNQEKHMTEYQSSLEKKMADRIQADEPRCLALAAEAQALRSELDRAAAERRDLESQLSELQKAKVGPASTAAQGKSESFEQQLDAISAFDVLTKDLNEVRAQLLDERLQKQRIEAAKNELEGQNAALNHRLEAASQRELVQQKAQETLETNIREGKLKIEKLEVSLESASAECRRLESKAKDLGARLEHSSSQASTQSIVEASMRRRQAELTACIKERQAELAQSQTALAENRVALRQTKERVQAALSRVIQELNDERMAACADAKTPTVKTLPVMPSLEAKSPNGGNGSEMPGQHELKSAGR